MSGKMCTPAQIYLLTLHIKKTPILHMLSRRFLSYYGLGCCHICATKDTANFLGFWFFFLGF